MDTFTARDQSMVESGMTKGGKNNYASFHFRYEQFEHNKSPHPWTTQTWGLKLKIPLFPVTEKKWTSGERAG